MPATRNPEPIRIGLIADEPIRLAGFTSIFDQPAQHTRAQLIPIPGSMKELLAKVTLKYLVVDMHSSASGLKALEAVRRARPDIRLIVIGPEGNDELVLKSIIAGARAYLDLSAGPETVRSAIEVVTNGSIWAPRRLLSKLIDQLLKTPESSTVEVAPQLTIRERQVLELILKARSNREIASQLGIEERTVRAHLARLMRKAGVDNRIKLSMSELSHSILRKESGSRTGVERARRVLTN
jgi:DNA-binding NarL/FixJ family response regulator